jgi:hypothetical protein
MDEYREARTRQEWRAQRCAAVDALQADAKAAHELLFDFSMQSMSGWIVQTCL